MSEPIFTTPSSWVEIPDAELSTILDAVAWTVDRWPAFCLYKLALNGQPFASAYSSSGKIWCDPEFRIKQNDALKGT